PVILIPAGAPVLAPNSSRRSKALPKSGPFPSSVGHPPRRQDEIVRRRQLAARLHPEERRDAGDDLARGRRRVQPRRRLSFLVARILRLIDHDEHKVLRRVARKYTHEY